MLDQEKTGKFIVNLRKEKKMTQEQLAEKLGVSNRSVSRWENGKTMPDLSLFPVIARELGVSVTELLNAERQEPGDRRTENARKIIAMSYEEKRLKAQKVNSYFMIGFFCAVILILHGWFGILDFVCDKRGREFFLGLLAGIGLIFEMAGFYFNSRDPKLTEREVEVLAEDSDHMQMKTAREMLAFAKKSQKADLPQYEKGFTAIEKELEPEEKVQFTLVGTECAFGEQPSCWHPVVAVTEKRLLIGGESIRGRFMTAYGVDNLLFSEIKEIISEGNSLKIYDGKLWIKISGKGLKEPAERLQGIVEINRK